METIIYWAETLDDGTEFTFLSNALLDVGVRVKDDCGRDAVITDFDIYRPISCEELNISWGLARALSM